MFSNFKNIYNQIEEKKIIERKVLSKEIYYKYIVRKVIKNSFLIDDSSGIYKIFKTPKFLLKLKKFNKKKIGYSLNIKKYKYKSNLNKNYSFNSLFFSNSLHLQSQLYNFKNNVAGLFNNRGKISLLLLRPVKCGYKVYSLGTLGFLPGSHYKKVLRFRPKLIRRKAKYISKILKFDKKLSLIWFYSQPSDSIKIRVKYILRKKYKKSKKFRRYKKNRKIKKDRKYKKRRKYKMLLVFLSIPKKKEIKIKLNYNKVMFLKTKM